MSDRGLRRLSSVLILTFLLVGGVPLAQPCHAEGEYGQCIDYSKLNLTTDQSNRIQQCDQEWFQEYQQTMPEIQQLRAKFQKLIASPKPADEAEIMFVQHQIDSKKTKLRMKATQITLKKKQILDEDQKKELNNQLQAEMAKKVQQHSGINTNIQPVRWQKIWSNMQNIFSQEKE